jgi:hypothetical protein
MEEKLTVAQLIKEFSNFMELRMLDLRLALQ